MIVVAALFTENSGDPSTGLALADIDMNLYRRLKTTGVVTQLWTDLNPTEEVGYGLYTRAYVGEDHSLYDYYAGAHYTGVVVLDTDYSLQSCSPVMLPIGAGAVEWQYQVLDPVNPIDGVEVWFTSDVAGAHVVWYGNTDALGYARDVYDNHPFLDAGTYYVWRQHSGYTFDNPDTEVVS